MTEIRIESTGMISRTVRGTVIGQFTRDMYVDISFTHSGAISIESFGYSRPKIK